MQITVDEWMPDACPTPVKDDSVKPIHVRYKAQRKQHMIFCGVCGVFKQRVAMGDNYCRNCGTRINWSDPEERWEPR